jgi:hypothetical protein
MSDRPYLGHWFGHGPVPEPGKMRVFTMAGVEEFKITNYHIDAGHLVLMIASPADGDSIRLDPIAVFAPGGWLGFAKEGGPESDPERMGFRPQPDLPPGPASTVTS